MQGGVYLGSIDIRRICRLRWRFDFAGKRSRFGIWNNAGGKQEEAHKTSAWCIDKTGLVRAAIEAEFFETWQERVILECDGHDFVNFEWCAATPAPMSTKGFVGESLTIHGQTIGLTLVTRELRQSAFVNGAIMPPEQRSFGDKAINLAGFGR